MKIHQLPMGARFVYQGQVYTKTGPLFATGTAGQRLIPRHAVLESCDARPLAPESVSASSAAIEAFCLACRQMLPPARQAEFDALHADLLARLTELNRR